MYKVRHSFADLTSDWKGERKPHPASQFSQYFSWCQPRNPHWTKLLQFLKKWPQELSLLTTQRISHHTSLPKLKETRSSSKRVASILFHHRKPTNNAVHVHDFHIGGSSSLPGSIAMKRGKRRILQILNLQVGRGNKLTLAMKWFFKRCNSSGKLEFPVLPLPPSSPLPIKCKPEELKMSELKFW